MIRVEARAPPAMRAPSPPRHLVHPLCSVGRHMSHQSGSGFTERPEELGQGVLVPALDSPHQAPGVVVDHARGQPRSTTAWLARGILDYPGVTTGRAFCAFGVHVKRSGGHDLLVLV